MYFDISVCDETLTSSKDLRLVDMSISHVISLVYCLNLSYLQNCVACFETRIKQARSTGTDDSAILPFVPTFTFDDLGVLQLQNQNLTSINKDLFDYLYSNNRVNYEFDILVEC